MSELSAALLSRVRGRKAIVGVLGLGYVGLPLAVAFSRKGVPVIGFEKSASKAAAVARGDSYIADVSDAELKEALAEASAPPPTSRA